MPNNCNHINDVTLGELFKDYPKDGVQVSITFSKEELWDVLTADVCLNSKSGIFDHILNQVDIKKNDRRFI